MSIAAVSTNLVDQQSATSVQQQSPGYFQQRRVDLQQLGQDLQAGNTSAAQNDFNAIQTLGQGGPFGGDAFVVSQRQQDFAAVGQALQSGNIAGAQQALTALRQTFNPRNSAPPPPTASGANGAGAGGNEIAEIVINIGSAAAASSAAPSSATSNPTQNATTTAAPTTSTASSAGGPEIVLNLGNATAGEQIAIGLNSGANGGEQLTVSVANQQNQTPEQITVNLQQGSNEQIVLNLFNSTNPTSTTTATQGSALSVTG